MSFGSNSSTSRSAYLPWYVVALALAAGGAVWMAAKMARTDEADFKLLLIGAVVMVGGVLLVLPGVVGRRR